MQNDATKDAVCLIVIPEIFLITPWLHRHSLFQVGLNKIPVLLFWSILSFSIIFNIYVSIIGPTSSGSL